MSFGLGLASLVLITIVWGSTFVVVKDALATISAPLLLAGRFTLAALALSWVGFDRRAIKPALWLGLLGFVGFATQTVGLGITSASNAAFITGLSVVLTPVVAAVFWRRPLLRRDYIAAVVGFVGLAVIATRHGLSAVNAGDLLILITAVSYAVFIVYLGEVGRDVNANSLAFMQHVPMALLAWVWVAPNLGEIVTVPTSTWVAVAFLALVATAGVAVLQVHAQRVVPAQLAALVFGLEPVFAAVFAYALLGEVLGWRGVVGGVLLVAAIAYSQVAHARSQPHAPDQVPPLPDGELRPPTPGTTWRQELSGETFDD
ncbi:MAG TPA: DMT family transporter [Trueperaceae bacterium]|nr:DMT family transporter [Trueperaceae bacterium]